MNFYVIMLINYIMWNVIASNRFLQVKMRKEAFKKHKESLKAVKPQINIKSPPKFSFLTTNPKGNQLAQQHLRQIQMGNTDLIRRMTSSKHKNRSLSREPFQKNSLHNSYSKRVSEQINKENQKMLQRLKVASSSINFNKLERQHRLTERIKLNLSKAKAFEGDSLKRSMRPQSAR